MHNRRIGFILAVVFTFSVQTFAGQESGGGGGVWYRDGNPVLIDFLNIDSDFKDSNTYQQWSASKLNKSLSLELTRSNEAPARNSLSALDLAMTIIEKWEKQFLDITGSHIHSAFMSPVKWSFKNTELTAPDSYLPLPEISKKDIRVAAYYENFTIQVSTKIWNELGIMSQAGLLIHEVLRHMQIGWSNDFDEKSLQHATALIMMCEPHSSINQYLFYITQNRSDLAEQLVGSFDEILASYCKRVL